MKLTVIAGMPGDLGREFALPAQGSLLLGRGPDTATVLHDVQVSKAHCRVEVGGGQVHLVDLGSRNRTFVGGPGQAPAPLEPHARRTLRPGQCVWLGTETILELAAPEDILKGVTRLDPGRALAFACRHCGAVLRPRPQCAGFQVRCPHCRGLVTLPGARRRG